MYVPFQFGNDLLDSLNGIFFASEKLFYNLSRAMRHQAMGLAAPCSHWGMSEFADNKDPQKREKVMPAKGLEAQHSISPIELVSIMGFSLSVAWMFLSFFWLFCDYPPNVPVAVSDMTQLLLFIGMAAGYIVQYFLGKKPSFNLFSNGFMGAVFLMSLVQPLIAFIMMNGVYMPLWVTCLSNLLAGISASAIITAWLDVLGRLKQTSYASFVGSGFVAGSILFFIAVSAPTNMQPMFASIYIVCSVALVAYTTGRAEGNDRRAPLKQIADPWMFTKEIEPSFFMFNLVFALSFVFLFNYGREYVLWGMIAIMPGAIVVAILGISKVSFSVTVLQRVLLAIAMPCCVLLPFTSGPLQLVIACIMIASWAVFTTSSYAFMVLKCSSNKQAPFFRQAPIRLCIPVVGFCAGWALASIFTIVFGVHDEAFTALHLIMTILLVITVMVFFPVRSHHPAGGGIAEEKMEPSSKVVIQMEESQLFDKKCQEIAKLYQLSPRESDILIYLAKGRNAAWIQEQLVISPHTVKSHIYNVYRKLDIHSQQKLMSFVEEYSLDSKSIEDGS